MFAVPCTFTHLGRSNSTAAKSQAFPCSFRIIIAYKYLDSCPGGSISANSATRLLTEGLPSRGHGQTMHAFHE